MHRYLLTNPDGQREMTLNVEECMEKKSIFCLKVNKYIKGTNTPEPLRSATELRADSKIRDVAKVRGDERLLGITSKDIAAAEAHYHFSCYRDYARPPKFNKEQTVLSKEEIKHNSCEKYALNVLYDYIRNNLFSNPKAYFFD